MVSQAKEKWAEGTVEAKSQAWERNILAHGENENILILLKWQEMDL